MSEKHGKTEYSQAEQSTYQTGSTIPPKSYKGIIAFLLGAVIFLCGISTALGLLNIRLFQQLQAQPDPTQAAVAFSRDLDASAAFSQETALGFTGETITDFWHTYHGLPLGVFIQTVEPGSEAARNGIVPGDILTSVNGRNITCIEELNTLLKNCAPGTSVRVGIYREEQHYEFSLTLDERN